MSAGETAKSFTETIGLFLDACPGPPLARTGIRIAAFQPVKGIPELYASSYPDRPPVVRSQSGGGGGGGGEDSFACTHRYLASATQVARRMKCRPAYLSKAAGKHGYSFSRALRWVRFLHGMALLGDGHRVDTVAWRLGFNDVAGWSRFTTRLVGRSPSQLPVLPLALWVRKAVNDVYFGIPASTAVRYR